MDFWDHLEELRRVIFKSLFVIAIAFIICLTFHDNLFNFLKKPLSLPTKNTSTQLHHTVTNTSEAELSVDIPDKAQSICVKKNKDFKSETYLNHIKLSPGESIDWDEPQSLGPKLTLLSPTEGLSTTLKLSLWVALVSSSPIWLYFFLGFAAPGLSTKELRWIIPFLCISLSLVGLGLLFAYEITLPIANRFLYEFNEKLATNLWSLTSYVNYTLIILLGNALAFESLAILFVLIHKGVISESALRKKRKLAIVAAFVVAAILTPPDVVTQCLLALPLYAFYEFGLLYAKWRGKYKIS